MDLPPTIPTSFVPHTSAAAQRRYRFDFIGAFSIVSYLILFVVVGMAIGVYGYGTFLQTQNDEKTAEIKKKGENIGKSTAEEFVRLNNLLTSTQDLLDTHLSFSRFLGTLSEIQPVTVRFSGMHITQADATKVSFDSNGVAKNFNALAVLSDAFAKDSRIRDAVFSHIAVNKDYSVTFNVAGTIDPTSIAYTAPSSSQQVAPPALPTNASTTISL